MWNAEPLQSSTLQSRLMTQMYKEIFESTVPGMQLSRLLRRNLAHVTPVLREAIVNDVSLGRTPLFLACDKGLTKVVNFLCCYCQPNVDLRCVYDDNSKKEFGNVTPLWCAAYEGHKDIIDVLLNYGADIDKVSDTGTSAVASACCRGDVNLVKFLVDKGADITKPTYNGMTCLMYSVGSAELCEYLIALGADVHAKDFECRTALHHAAEYSVMVDDETNILETVELLMSHGVDPYLKTVHGDDALRITCINGTKSIFQYLINRLELSVELKADSYELFGCIEEFEQATACWKIATEIRQTNSIVKDIRNPVRAFGFSKEYRNIEELENLMFNDLAMQRVLITHRIIGPNHKEFLISNFDIFKVTQYTHAIEDRKCIPIWLYGMEIELFDTIMEDAGITTATNILKIFLLIIEDLPIDEVNEHELFEDVFFAMKLIGDQISDCQKVMYTKPQYKLHHDNFDAALSILLHFLYVALKVADNEEKYEQLKDYMSNIINLQPRTMDADQSLLHLSVQSCHCDATIDTPQMAVAEDAHQNFHELRVRKPDNKVRVPLSVQLDPITRPFPDIKVTTFLLECGASVNAISNFDKSTPIFIATLQIPFRKEIVQLLVDHNAHFDTKSSDGDSAYDVLKGLMEEEHLGGVILPVLALQCIAGTAVRDAGIEIEPGDIPAEVKDMLDLH